MTRDDAWCLLTVFGPVFYLKGLLVFQPASLEAPEMMHPTFGRQIAQNPAPKLLQTSAITPLTEAQNMVITKIACVLLCGMHSQLV